MHYKTPGAFLATIVVLAGAALPAVAAPSASDACSLLTQAEVTSALGASVGAGAWVAPTFKTTCTWRAAPGGGYVTLMMEGLDAFNAGKVAYVKTIVVTPVSGIGDDAYYLAIGNNVGLIVKKGTAAFKVAVYGQESLDQKEAIEKTLATQVVPEL
jgi:hypothetical protein